MLAVAEKPFANGPAGEIRERPADDRGRADAADDARRRCAAPVLLKKHGLEFGWRRAGLPRAEVQVASARAMRQVHAVELSNRDIIPRRPNFPVRSEFDAQSSLNVPPHLRDCTPAGGGRVAQRRSASYVSSRRLGKRPSPRSSSRPLDWCRSCRSGRCTSTRNSRRCRTASSRCTRTPPERGR